MKMMRVFFPVLLLCAAGPALAGSPGEALEKCLTGVDRATSATLAQPPEDIGAQLRVLAAQDSGCIGTAFSACAINRFTTSGCIVDLTHLLQGRLSQAMATHPFAEDRAEGLRAAYDNWLSSLPAPCDPKLTGGEEICTALGLGGRLIEARGWARRFDIETLE